MAWCVVMQCFKQRSELKITVFLWKRMCGSCFCSHGKPSTTGYWLNLVTNKSRTLRCVPAPKAKTMRTVCVIAPEETVLLLATVRFCGCCNGENFNPCSCANKESMNDAVAPQSAIAKVLSKVSLLAIVHDRTMWSHCLFVLATSALADIDNDPSLIGLREQLCSETVCFPMCCLTMLLYLTMLLSSRGCQLHGG